MQPVMGSAECSSSCSNTSAAPTRPPKANRLQWLLDWMAYPLQNPAQKLASAVIMHGPQGTGKSTIFQTLAQIYGDYSTVLNQRGLEGQVQQRLVGLKALHPRRRSRHPCRNVAHQNDLKNW